MTIDTQKPVPAENTTDVAHEQLTLEERRLALSAASLARAQEAYRLSLLNPPVKETRRTGYGRIRNNWRNAYD